MNGFSLSPTSEAVPVEIDREMEFNMRLRDLWVISRQIKREGDKCNKLFRNLENACLDYQDKVEEIKSKLQESKDNKSRRIAEQKKGDIVESPTDHTLVENDKKITKPQNLIGPDGKEFSAKFHSPIRAKSITKRKQMNGSKMLVNKATSNGGGPSSTKLIPHTSLPSRNSEEATSQGSSVKVSTIDQSKEATPMKMKPLKRFANSDLMMNGTIAETFAIIPHEFKKPMITAGASRYPRALRSRYPRALPSRYPRALPSRYPRALPSRYPRALPALAPPWKRAELARKKEAYQQKMALAKARVVEWIKKCEPIKPNAHQHLQVTLDTKYELEEVKLVKYNADDEID